MYLFLAALGLCCFEGAFSSFTKWGLLFVEAKGFSLWWLLLLPSTGSRHLGFRSCSAELSSCGLQALECGLGSRGTWA